MHLSFYCLFSFVFIGVSMSAFAHCAPLPCPRYFDIMYLDADLLIYTQGRGNTPNGLIILPGGRLMLGTA